MKERIESDKHKTFRKIILENREKLKAGGFPESTISRWAAGDRIPRQFTAMRIAEVLKIPIQSIPYHIDVLT